MAATPFVRNSAMAMAMFAGAALLATGCPQQPKPPVVEPAPAVAPKDDSPAAKLPADPPAGDPPVDPTPPDGANNDPPVGITPNTGNDPVAGTSNPPNKPAVEPATLPPNTPAVDPSQSDPVAAGDPASPANPPQTDDTQREALFVDWPRPLLALMVTGRQHGYIEPCGCAGLENQKGGLSRRQTLLRELTAREWPVVAIDAGNQVRRFGKQPAIKFNKTITGLKSIGYAAIAFGPDDLRLSVTDLIGAIIGDDAQPAPFVSANVNVLDQAPTHRVVESGGRKIGITAILGSEHIKQATGDELQLTEPAAALPAAVEKLQAEKCDLLVLIAHTSMEESRALAEKFPQFQLIVTTGGAGEPTREAESLPSGAKLIQVGAKGMYAGVVGVYDDAKTPLRYQRVPLDGRFKDSPEMLKLLSAYQQELESLGLAGLEVTPRAHPSGRTYVGSAACADCHSTAYAIWEKTPHAHATETLVHPPERYEVPRHFDPECLSCHVTGWNPQGFQPYTGGYEGLKRTAHLTGSGCENCHGPGSAHVAVENGDVDANEEELMARRLQMRLPLADARQKCLECHDLDNSPNFHESPVEEAFKKYWSKVEHKGKD